METPRSGWVRITQSQGPKRGDLVRERLAFGILVFVMIFLFAFVFYVLGRGEYKPSPEGAAPSHVISGPLA